MDGYIALKNTVFNGIGYTAGSIVPTEAVLPSRVPALLRNGTIAKAGGETEAPAVNAELTQTEPKADEGVVLPIQTENGAMGLPASREDVVKAIEVLQMKKDDALAAVAEIASEDALIIIDACTKTQEIKKAIRERVKAIQTAEDNEGQSTDPEGIGKDGEE